MIRHRCIAALLALVVCAPLARAADLDPYLPEDTESILNVNVRQILDSDLIKKNALEMAQEVLRGQNEVQDIFKDLGFDPFKDLDRIVVASPGGTEKDRGLIVMHGKFDVAKFKAKAEEVVKNDAEHLKIHKVLGGKHQLYEVNMPELDEPIYVAIPSGDTLVFSPGKDYVLDALKKSGNKEKPALKNKQFQTLLEKLDAKQSISLAVVKTPGITKAMEQAPGDVKEILNTIEALGGGLTITDEIKMELVVTAKNAKSAGELQKSAKAGLDLALAGLATLTQMNPAPGIELVVDVVKSVKVKNDGANVVIKARITSDTIEEAIKKKSK
jgi:hypothetical protein